MNENPNPYESPDSGETGPRGAQGVYVALRNFLNPNGRASRATFWKVHGSFYAVVAMAGYLSEAGLIPEWIEGAFPDWFLGLLLWPILGLLLIVEIKRWHDMGKSGWRVFIKVIPLLGPLWFFIDCGLTKGTEGPNEFGDDPLLQPLPGSDVDEQVGQAPRA